MWVGSDSSYFGVQGSLLHLERVQIDVVIDATLGEERDIFETIVALDDMMKIGMSFATNVLQGFHIEKKLRRVFRAAFAVHLAVLDDRFEPGKVFIVMSHDNLKVRSGQTRGGGGL